MNNLDKIFVCSFFLFSFFATFCYAAQWDFDTVDKLFNKNFYPLGLDYHNFETDKDYLKLGSDIQVFGYLWVANSAESSVSKVDTNSAKEVARYKTGPGSGGTESPSRTAVDKDGNVWVGNRGGSMAVVKIAANKASCIDKNGNGKIDTSNDDNNNGVIDAGEILPWGSDECVLLSINHWPEIPLNSLTQIGPRALAIDSNGYVWVGTWSNYKYYKLDPVNGDKLAEGSLLTGAYGMAAGQGVIWINEVGTGITSVDINTNQIKQRFGNTIFGCSVNSHCFYVIAADKYNNVWVANWELGLLQKLESSTGIVTNFSLPGAGVTASVRGVTIASNGMVWVTNCSADTGTVYKVLPVSFGGFAKVLCSVDLGNRGGVSLAGLSEDNDKYVWAISGANKVFKLNPANCNVEAEVDVGGGPYTYSDATGNLVQQFIKDGWWYVILGDATGSGVINKWSNISWSTSSIKDGGYVDVTLDFSNGKSLSYRTDANKNSYYSLEGNDSENLKITIKVNKNNDDTSPVVEDLVVMTSGSTICNSNDICDADEGCSCEDCWDKQDGCLEGNICNPNIKQCECEEGKQLCDDGTCKEVCEFVCDLDNQCDYDENCSCSDCFWKQDKCLSGNVCDPNKKECVCEEGKQLCDDGTCKEDCKSECNLNGVCEDNEGCSCSDCFGKEDNCDSLSSCGSDGVCLRCKLSMVKWKSPYDNCCGVFCIAASGQKVNLSASGSSECEDKNFDFRIFLNSDVNQKTVSTPDSAKFSSGSVKTEWSAFWTPDGNKDYAEYNFSIGIGSSVLGYSSNLLKVCEDDMDCDGVLDNKDDCGNTPCDEAPDEKGCSESQRNDACFSKIDCTMVNYPDCKPEEKYVFRPICLGGYYDGTGECCNKQSTCACQLNDCQNRGTWIRVYKECAAEEEFPFFSATNIVVVLSLLVLFYLFGRRRSDN
ncbi:MAG: hypothetical protein QXR60_00720 [Candidatus Nanoarchaeia archaeon]